ncbi:MAG: ABC transporter ATP-binding protein [SAR324 cluster bacterium]|nr:ABC transporter ATP-binding protein [SAR324 cluster bacterium]
MSEFQTASLFENKGVWKQLFVMFLLPQKKRFLLLIAVAVIVAGIEATFTIVTKLVIDEVVTHGKDAYLLQYAFIYFGLTVSISVSVFIFILLAGRLSTEMMYHLRKQSFEHLQKLSFSFYDRHSVGWLLARITSDCERIARIIAWGTLDLFWAGPMLLGALMVLLVLNWKLALTVMGIIPVLLVVSLYFKNLILESSRRVRRTNSLLTATYNEGITGSQTSKILVREQENFDEFKVSSEEMHGYSITNTLQASAYFPLVIVTASIGTGVALWIGGEYVIGGLMTLGTLIAFITYTRDFSEPLLHIAEVLTNLQQAQACAERILGLLNVAPEIKDSAELTEQMRRSKTEHVKNNLRIKEIEFKNTFFAYKQDQPVLKDFNIKIPAGKTIALVGPTGSGKSTIANLICRFYEPTKGEILINGIDYRKRSLKWLQSNLGIVLQTPFLFSGTIESNIQYGNLTASKQEIVDAAKMVHVHDLIMAMENGYKTEVEEGGSNFSTGQKQLLSFARAILADPQIFVMDEATSAVDTHTEHLIQKGLSKVLENRTSFIIAHRLSTIRSADTILVIEEGEIKEQGKHEELLQLKGKYHDLYQTQFI